MKWANFLHFYQPATQQKDVLEAVVNECYRPLFKGLLRNQKARLTVNVSGSLLELLDMYGFADVIDTIKHLYETGRVEFTSTACYHAFLPLVPVNEVRRQITLNDNMLRNYISKSMSVSGFFPPEMGVNTNLIDIVSDMGFEYIILDEISSKNVVKEDQRYIVNSTANKHLNVFFRRRAPSNMIMSGIERNSKSINQLIKQIGKDGYIVTGMDGETFGHHRPGMERTFLELFDEIRDIEFVKIYDLIDDKVSQTSNVNIVDSTWASSEHDISNNIQFISWKDPDNIIHTWQWELVNLMLLLLSGVDKNHVHYSEIRILADKALASDQFFWASAKPWWSVEMIESGAHAVLNVIERISQLFGKDLEVAISLYLNIVSTAFEWQRSGKIREMSKERYSLQRIPFKERTLEKGGTESAVYNAFIDMMKLQEKEAAGRGEYEKAILWRDAVYKIDTKNDVYDAINAVDLLRMEISNEKVEEMLDKYTARYKEIRGGQPEQRSN